MTIYPSKTAGWVGTLVHLVERKLLLPHPCGRFFYHPNSGWSRDQPQPGSLFQRLRVAEKRDPGNKVGPQIVTVLRNYVHIKEEIFRFKAIGPDF